MSERKICPVMTAGVWAFPGHNSGPHYCDGSRCAWWVAGTPYTVTYEDGEAEYYDPGTCARNPSGEPYPDPAGEGE
uniref:Uncharacterized protein n=1 Tax=viral metagenome TaxID=1070528 RepID=A0A6M3M749_9ZZZZ